MQGPTHFKKLRAAYDRAFERLGGEIHTLKIAEQRVIEAELAYRHARNELAQFILEQKDEVVDEVEEVST